MAAIGRILSDERSAIRTRHATIASIFAAASVAAGIFLMVAGNQLYEHTGQRLIWTLAAGGGAIG
jgi:hypothetical protein